MIEIGKFRFKGHRLGAQKPVPRWWLDRIESQVTQRAPRQPKFGTLASINFVFVKLPQTWPLSLSFILFLLPPSLHYFPHVQPSFPRPFGTPTWYSLCSRLSTERKRERHDVMDLGAWCCDFGSLTNDPLPPLLPFAFQWYFESLFFNLF